MVVAMAITEMLWAQMRACQGGMRVRKLQCPEQDGHGSATGVARGGDGEMPERLREASMLLWNWGTA